MILAYVAGPYSAPTRKGVQANIARAVAVGLEIAKLGAFPVIPHANTAHSNLESLQPYPFWIEGTLLLLRRCDVLVSVPGWEKSSGARGEVLDAAERSQPIFHSLVDLEAWLRAFEETIHSRDTIPDLIAPEGRMVGVERGALG